MDGYAVRDADVTAGARLRVIGEAAAGHAFSGVVTPGEAVRIFTGAPVPVGADRVIIQEDVNADDQTVTLNANIDSTFYIRPLGTDFKVGDRILSGRRLNAADIALAASMNVPTLQVARQRWIRINFLFRAMFFSYRKLKIIGGGGFPTKE